MLVLGADRDRDDCQRRLHSLPRPNAAEAGCDDGARWRHHHVSRYHLRLRGLGACHVPRRLRALALHPLTLRQGARVMPGGSPATSGVAARKRATYPDDNQMPRNPNLA